MSSALTHEHGHAAHAHDHAHGDGHPHGHDHDHVHEAGVVAPAARSASVAIEIGPGVGALILYPAERYRGREIEISRLDGDGRRTHTGVHERTTERAALLTAIFGSLPAGEYRIWEDNTTPGPVVTVPEAGIAELKLS
jgi:hypothetical protein